MLQKKKMPSQALAPVPCYKVLRLSRPHWNGVALVSPLHSFEILEREGQDPQLTLEEGLNKAFYDETRGMFPLIEHEVMVSFSTSLDSSKRGEEERVAPLR